MNPAQILDSIQNTKAACLLCTLGLRLAKPGVYITYNQQHRVYSRGIAHFLFESSQNTEARRYLAIYDAGIADITLDSFLDESKGKSPEIDRFISELEKLLLEALIVYGRRFLDNYDVISKSLKRDISKFVVTGGTPVFDKAGKVCAIENFKITQ